MEGQNLTRGLSPVEAGRATYTGFVRRRLTLVHNYISYIHLQNIYCIYTRYKILSHRHPLVVPLSKMQSPHLAWRKGAAAQRAGVWRGSP
jgi:hypothetical protein